MTNNNHYTSTRRIAQLFAEADKRSDADRIHLQLRGLAARGLLSAIPNLYGPKGALYYPEREVYRARLLIAAVDLGIVGLNLIELDSALPYFLDDAIRGAANGDAWELAIAHFPPSPITGGANLSIYFGRAPLPADLLRRAAVDGAKLRAVTRIDLTVLFRGILPVVG